MRKYTIYLIIALATTVLAVTACASIGEPDGGRYDEEPPYVVRSTPANGTVNFNRKKVNILFNEFVKLTGANEKVIISPPQLEAANVRAEGKSVKVTLYDSLQPNTTYTIDFGDAIEDNNEGNPMGFYTFSFGTGDVIDTMQVGGTVIQADNMEPVKSILVGLYRMDSSFTDDTFRKAPLLRISRTNGNGQFSIKGVAPGRYRAFALKDADGDFRFSQKSEMIAFDTAVVIPWQKSDLRFDTCWHDSIHYDSIRVVPYIHYFPDNLVLRAFMEGGQDRHLLKHEHPVSDWFRLYFTAPSNELPYIKGLNFDEKCLVTEASEHRDTITYWITDTALTHRTDTLEMTVRFLDTDTLGNLAYKTDTLTMVSRKTWAQAKEEREKSIEKWNKERAKRERKSKVPLPAERNPFETDFLDVRLKPTGMLDPNRNVFVETTQPILNVDSAKVHLYTVRDSDLTPEPFLFLPTKNNSRSYTMYAEWKPGEKYCIILDSMAIRGVMGTETKHVKNTFSVQDLDQYGALFVKVISPDTGAVVQLLGKDDKVVCQQRVARDGTADFYYMRPDTYYMRCYIDANGNNVWDTGDYAQGRQPEMVYYFPKPLVVRAKWDIEQAWELNGIGALSQKPSELIRQKADQQKKPRDLNKERDREMQRRRNRGEK